MLTQDKINELREEFNERIRSQFHGIRWIAPEYKQNVIDFSVDFWLSKIDLLLKEQRDGLVEKIMKVKTEYPEYESDGYDSGCKRTLEEVLSIIKQ